MDRPAASADAAGPGVFGPEVEALDVLGSGPGGAGPDGSDGEAAAALRADAEHLAAADPALGRAWAESGGALPFAPRPAGFGALLKVILEQQVSVLAANAMWAKLRARLGHGAPGFGEAGDVTPAAFLTLDDEALRACGFSRQKAAYGRALAQATVEGRLDFAGLARLGDEAAIARLTALKGIGRWSAENYLLWSLRRRDVFPAQDLGLLLGWQWLTEAAIRPTPDDLRAVAAPWRPRRTAATFMIWGFYLKRVADRRRR